METALGYLKLNHGKSQRLSTELNRAEDNQRVINTRKKELRGAIIETLKKNSYLI